MNISLTFTNLLYICIKLKKLIMVKVLKFYADWCKPCHMLTEILEGKEYDPVDITQEKELTEQYKVRSVPTLVFLKDGVEMHRYSGLMYPKQFDEVIERLSNTETTQEDANPS